MLRSLGKPAPLPEFVVIILRQTFGGSLYNGERKRKREGHEREEEEREREREREGGENDNMNDDTYTSMSATLCVKSIAKEFMRHIYFLHKNARGLLTVVVCRFCIESLSLAASWPCPVLLVLPTVAVCWICGTLEGSCR